MSLDSNCGASLKTRDFKHNRNKRNAKVMTVNELHLAVALLLIAYLGLTVYTWKHWRFYATFHLEQLNTMARMVGGAVIMVLAMSLTLVGHPQFAFSVLGVFVTWVLFIITEFESIEE